MGDVLHIAVDQHYLHSERLRRCHDGALTELGDARTLATAVFRRFHRDRCPQRVSAARGSRRWMAARPPACDGRPVRRLETASGLPRQKSQRSTGAQRSGAPHRTGRFGGGQLKGAPDASNASRSARRSKAGSRASRAADTNNNTGVRTDRCGACSAYFSMARR